MSINYGGARCKLPCFGYVRCSVKPLGSHFAPRIAQSPCLLAIIAGIPIARLDCVDVANIHGVNLLQCSVFRLDDKEEDNHNEGCAAASEYQAVQIVDFVNNKASAMRAIISSSNFVTLCRATNKRGMRFMTYKKDIILKRERQHLGLKKRFLDKGIHTSSKTSSKLLPDPCKHFGTAAGRALH